MISLRPSLLLLFLCIMPFLSPRWDPQKREGTSVRDDVLGWHWSGGKGFNSEKDLVDDYNQALDLKGSKGNQEAGLAEDFGEDFTDWKTL